MAKYLATCEKMMETIEVLEGKMQDHKKYIDDCRAEIKSLRKQLSKMMQKQEKQQSKNKKDRQLHGFARPTAVSDELCVFMGKEKGTLVSRTEVTKFLIQYISDNKLQNPENRRNILIDDKLKKLFGPETEKEKVDYFNMQRFVNKHFPKAKA